MESTDHHAAALYDAVGDVWLRAYGPHVHVGLYDDVDDPQRPSWGAAQHRTVEELLRLSGLESAERLIDIGCGHGATACHMAERLGAAAVGVNISPFQVAAANELAAARGLAGRAKFIVADGMAPPFEDASFDLAVSVESAAYMPDKPRFISEIARLLKPGGRVVLADFCRAPGELTPLQQARLDAIDAAFASAGDWHSAGAYAKLFAANGLRVVEEADWTGRVRGFWEIGMREMMLWRTPELEAEYSARWLPRNALAMGARMAELSAAVGVATVRGGLEPLKMTVWGFLCQANKRVMRRAFASGALRYRVLVAEKPSEARRARGGKAAAPLARAASSSDDDDASGLIGAASRGGSASSAASSAASPGGASASSRSASGRLSGFSTD